MIGRGEPYIRAYSGRRYYVRHPALNPEIHLSDLAYGLARISRFTGHTRHRYSVASHSLMVADIAMPADAGATPGNRHVRRAAIVHDAIEGLLGDMSSPVKSLCPEYRELQSRWEDALAIRWRVSFNHPDVKAADRLAYAIERRDLCPYGDDAQGWDIETEIEIPPNAPRCTAYTEAPRHVEARWLRECRALGIPEIA